MFKPECDKDYHDLAEHFIFRQENRGFDPYSTLGQLRNEAVVIASEGRPDVVTDPKSVQEHYERLVIAIKQIANGSGDV